MSDPVQIIAEGRFLRFAKRQNWEYVERVNVRDVAVLVPITSEDEIVLVEQFRIPVQARMIELPAGLVGDEEEFREEDLLDAANRELEEETGYRAERLTLLTRAPSSGGNDQRAGFVPAREWTEKGRLGGRCRWRGHYCARRAASRGEALAAWKGSGRFPAGPEDPRRTLLGQTGPFAVVDGMGSRECEIGAPRPVLARPTLIPSLAVRGMRRLASRSRVQA